MSEQLHKVIISGGGTGGHVFPAIAIADAIKRRYPECQILFVGAEGKMEMEKVPAAGYQIVGLPIAGLQRKLSIKLLSFPFKLMRSLSKARKVVRDFGPEVAIGVGGYASGPTLRIAGRQGIPTILQEQNSFPGMTNRILAKKAAKICVAYNGMDRFFDHSRIVHTGNPVRKDISAQLPEQGAARQAFGLEPDKATLLVLGGSLGAKTINESLLTCIHDLLDAGIQVIWQCGKYYEQELQAKVVHLSGKGLYLSAFIKDMATAYAAADAVVSRAGALSVSELCIVGKPVIFIPSPNVSDDHQTKNAQALIQQDAAILVTDQSARENLGNVIVELMQNNERMNQLSEKIKELAIPDADERIVNTIMEVIHDC